MRAPIVILAALALMLAGCGAARQEAKAIDAHADAVYLSALAKEKAAHATTKAEKAAALADLDVAQAKAKAAADQLRQEEDAAERASNRRYATLCGVLAAMLGVLAIRLPLLRTPLGLAVAALTAGSMAFETFAWLVGYRWLVPSLVGTGGIGWALWHLIQSHDALHQLVQHAEVDTSALAGKAVALVDRIKAHHEWHLPAAFRRRVVALGARWHVGPGTAFTSSTGPATMTGTTASLAPLVDATHAGDPPKA